MYKNLLCLIAGSAVAATAVNPILACNNQNSNANLEKTQWKGLIRNWTDVNPNRSASVTNIVQQDANYVFQPYYDGGLWEGTTVRDAINGVNTTLHNGKKVFNQVKLNSLTISFVQQAIAQQDKLELTVAGQSLGDGYDYWVDNKYKPEVLNPFAAANKFKNLVVAYGGAASAVGYNPWTVALKIANNNIDQAVGLLIPAFTEYQKRITKFAGLNQETNMPMNLDFDIEGNSVSETNGLKVLFKALAKMKNENPKWNFTVTLPVLPEGVPDNIFALVKNALAIYKSNGLSVNDIFDINVMGMDYGESYGNDVIKKHLTFFDLAKNVITNTGKQFQAALKAVFPDQTQPTNINQKLLFTPMLGINDVNNNYFTLEDAKDLYNYVQTNKVKGIRMWSLNRDDCGKIAEVWSTTNHGLKYLNKLDYSHAFNGDWTDWVKTPIRKV